MSGNIREMENVIERAVLLSSSSRLEIDLPLFSQHIDDSSFADMPTLDEIQKRYIQFVLSKTNGKISGPGSASEILGLKMNSTAGEDEKAWIVNCF